MCRAHTGDREGTRAWIRATGASSGMGTVSGEVAERTPGKRTREDRGCEAWRMSRPGRGDAGGTGWSRQQTPLKPRVEGDGDPLGWVWAGLLGAAETREPWEAQEACSS